MFRFDPYSPAIDADPFPAYRRLRDDFPCFWSDEANAWVLSRFADIVAALNDWRTYSSAEGNLMTEVRNRAGATCLCARLPSRPLGRPRFPGYAPSPRFFALSPGVALRFASRVAARFLRLAMTVSQDATGASPIAFSAKAKRLA